MAHGLVGEAQWAQRPVIAEDDSMLQSRAPHEAPGQEGLRLAQQAEGAGGRQARVVGRSPYPALGPDGRVVAGGSTLTMQVARLLERLPTGSLAAKWDQAVGAAALERGRTKEDILGLYLRLAPYGGTLRPRRGPFSSL